MRRLVSLVFALALAGAACSGSDAVDVADDPGPTSTPETEAAVSATPTPDGDAEPEPNNGDDAPAADEPEPAPESSGDVDSVFPLPAAAIEVLFPLNVTDDEFVHREQATFVLTGTDLDAVIAFYQETLPPMGYEVGPPLELGESIALNISDPDRPNLTAVVQAGPQTPGEPAIQLNQEKSELKEAGEEDAGAPDDDPAATSSDAAAGSNEDSGSTDALDVTGDRVGVDWASLPSTPFFAPPAAGGDPFFHIHTNPAPDGFFLSFEMYTTGYGQQWTGQVGTFDISCLDPVNSTGICPYFDPDGPGPEPVLGEDFGATGSLTITQLDDTGYDITVHELTFSDGTTFEEFSITG